MKSYFAISLLVLLAVSACDPKTELSVGFDSGFDPGGYGTTILSIDNALDKVYLEGMVKTDSGSVTVQLLYPSGSMAWHSTLSGQNEIQVNEMFDSSPGDWVLKYESTDGAGTIKLNLHN